jgi:hypothetical protein
VHGRALVAHVDDADTFRVEAHPDRHDVPAAQGKHALDAARLEYPCNTSRDAIRRKFHHGWHPGLLSTLAA